MFCLGKTGWKKGQTRAKNIYIISLGSLVYYKTHPGSVTVASQWHIYNLTVSTAFVKIEK